MFRSGNHGFSRSSVMTLSIDVTDPAEWIRSCADTPTPCFSHVDNGLFRRPNHTQAVSQFSHYHREVQQAEP